MGLTNIHLKLIFSIGGGGVDTWKMHDTQGCYGGQNQLSEESSNRAGGEILSNFLQKFASRMQM